MKASKFIFPFFVSSALLTSCGEAETTNENNPTEEVAAEIDSTVVISDIDAEAQFKMDLLISNSIAGPSQLITDINNDGTVEFVEGVTLVMENGRTFEGTNMTKGLMFGALGADLTYLGIHDRPDLALKHVAAINKLSQDLDCGMEMTDENMEKFESAKNDGKAMSDMMFDEYSKVDEYLRSNDRLETAAHILTGGLIESLYIVTSQLKDKEIEDKGLEALYGQKQSINELVSVFESLDETDGNSSVLEHLKNISSVFMAEPGLNKESINSLYESAKEFRDEIADESIM